MEKFARVCNVTGKGMNEGWHFEGSGDYASTKEAAIKLCREHYPEHKDVPDEELIDRVYDEEGIYWTEWYDEDLEDHGYYYTANGEYVEL